MKIKFKIHPFFYIFAFICIMTAYFKNFIYIMIIIVIHEIGHLLISYFYKWQIDKVIILPFGAITLFNEKINKKMKEELLITLMGPIFQIPLFFINNHLFRKYNLLLLIFNLIPIFPLDGSKIINIFLNKIFSFKKSHILSIIISIIMLFHLVLLPYNFIRYVVIVFLILKTIKEIKQHKYLFNKFLFERYLYDFDFKKIIIVNNYIKMKRDYKHLIKNNKNYQTEKEFLKKLFKV